MSDTDSIFTIVFDICLVVAILHITLTAPYYKGWYERKWMEFKKGLKK